MLGALLLINRLHIVPNNTLVQWFLMISTASHTLLELIFKFVRVYYIYYSK